MTDQALIDALAELDDRDAATYPFVPNDFRGDSDWSEDAVRMFVTILNAVATGQLVTLADATAVLERALTRAGNDAAAKSDAAATLRARNICRSVARKREWADGVEALETAEAEILNEGFAKVREYSAAALQPMGGGQ